MEHRVLINELREEIDAAKESIETIEAVLKGLVATHEEVMSAKRRKLDKDIELMELMLEENLSNELKTVESTLQLSNDLAIKAHDQELEELLLAVTTNYEEAITEAALGEVSRRKRTLEEELSAELREIPSSIERATAERLSLRIAEIRAAQEEIRQQLVE